MMYLGVVEEIVVVAVEEGDHFIIINKKCHNMAKNGEIKYGR